VKEPIIPKTFLRRPSGDPRQAGTGDTDEWIRADKLTADKHSVPGRNQNEKSLWSAAALGCGE